MQTAPVDGDLTARLAANLSRLRQPDYEPATVLRAGVESDWPADLPGRLILALASHSRTGRTDADRLEQLVAGLPAHLNERGYLGAVHPAGTVSEQQLAGHGWLVSGLLRHAGDTGDDRAAAMAMGIVDQPAAARDRAAGQLSGPARRP